MLFLKAAPLKVDCYRHQSSVFKNGSYNQVKLHTATPASQFLCDKLLSCRRAVRLRPRIEFNDRKRRLLFPKQFHHDILDRGFPEPHGPVGFNAKARSRKDVKSGCE